MDDETGTSMISPSEIARWVASRLDRHRRHPRELCSEVSPLPSSFCVNQWMQWSFSAWIITMAPQRRAMSST